MVTSSPRLIRMRSVFSMTEIVGPFRLIHCDRTRCKKQLTTVAEHRADNAKPTMKNHMVSRFSIVPHNPVILECGFVSGCGCIEKWGFVPNSNTSFSAVEICKAMVYLTGYADGEYAVWRSNETMYVSYRYNACSPEIQVIKGDDNEITIGFRNWTLHASRPDTSDLYLQLHKTGWIASRNLAQYFQWDPTTGCPGELVIDNSR